MPKIIKKGSCDFMENKTALLSEIKIPWNMTQTIPKKYAERLKYYKDNNKLIRPIEVDEKMRLIDGYTSYLILKECEVVECDVQLFKYIRPYSIRKSKHTLEEIESLLDKKNYPVKREEMNKKTKINFNGEIIRKHSIKILVFFLKGYKCVSCGIEGCFFALENIGGIQNGYALNLYSVNHEGKEILMTIDHIIPKARGGGNDLQNLQPMCLICNELKGQQDYIK